MIESDEYDGDPDTKYDDPVTACSEEDHHNNTHNNEENYCAIPC